MTLFIQSNFVILFFLFSCICASEIVTLTQQNFDGNVENGDWLITFCKPTHFACREFEPIFEVAAKKLTHLQFGRIDVSKAEELTTRYQIDYYPTIFFIKDGELREFDLIPSVDNIIHFAEEDYINVETEPLPEPVPPEDEEYIVELSASDFDSSVTNGRWFVEIGASWCNHCKAIIPIWTEVADILFDEGSDVTIGYIDGSKAAGIVERFKVEGFPTFLYFENGVYSEYNGDATVDGLLNFLDQNMKSSRPIPSRNFLYILRFEFLENYSKWLRENVHVTLLLVSIVCSLAGFAIGHSSRSGPKKKTKELPRTQQEGKIPPLQKSLSPRTGKKQTPGSPEGSLATPRTAKARTTPRDTFLTIKSKNKTH